MSNCYILTVMMMLGFFIYFAAEMASAALEGYVNRLVSVITADGANIKNVM